MVAAGMESRKALARLSSAWARHSLQAKVMMSIRSVTRFDAPVAQAQEGLQFGSDRRGNLDLLLERRTLRRVFWQSTPARTELPAWHPVSSRRMNFAEDPCSA